MGIEFIIPIGLLFLAAVTLVIEKIESKKRKNLSEKEKTKKEIAKQNERERKVD